LSLAISHFSYFATMLFFTPFRQRLRFLPRYAVAAAAADYFCFSQLRRCCHAIIYTLSRHAIIERHCHDTPCHADAISPCRHATPG
jgi:hypothetical protein